MYDENQRFVYIPVRRKLDPHPENTITLCWALFVIIAIGVLALYAVHTLFTTFPITREIWEAVWPWIRKAFAALLDFRFF
jgi:hypothetical protein